MIKEDLQKTLEALGKSGITVAGDLVIEKNVQYEVNAVQNGGIGIQITNDKGGASLTSSDKDIKAVLEQLMEAMDDKEKYIFTNKKQWWAVHRVLSTYCNYPKQMKAFEAKLNDLGVSKIDGKRDFSYESLIKASNDVPQFATCSPDNWYTMKDKSDQYRQQYNVAEFMMHRLGIKS